MPTQLAVAKMQMRHQECKDCMHAKITRIITNARTGDHTVGVKCARARWTDGKTGWIRVYQTVEEFMAAMPREAKRCGAYEGMDDSRDEACDTLVSTFTLKTGMVNDDARRKQVKVFVLPSPLVRE